MKLHQKRGFTLIELLTAVAIIGLIGSLIMAAIGRRRVRDRDVRRLAEMSQLQKSLDLAFANANRYPDPVSPSVINLGDPEHDVLCGNGNTSVFTSDTTSANCDQGKLYVPIVPRDPGYPSHQYKYRTYSGGATYCIQFDLEVGGINNLQAGFANADQDSVTNGPCPL